MVARSVPHARSGQATYGALQVLDDLLAAGYTLDVRTRVEIWDHHEGPHAGTYADKLTIKGPKALTPELRSAVATRRDALLAAACVMHPPVGWLGILVERFRTGHAVEVRRSGWAGPYRVRLAMIAANVAAFVGLHPARDGPHLEPVIAAALDVRTGEGAA